MTWVWSEKNEVFPWQRNGGEGDTRYKQWSQPRQEVIGCILDNGGMSGTKGIVGEMRLAT